MPADSMRNRRHVAIVGGGVAGLAAFIELVRRSAADEISIIDLKPYGGGEGFRAIDRRLLCNTSAETLSVLHGRTDDFQNFLSASGHPASPDAFAPRRDVFAYFKSRYVRALADAAALEMACRWIEGAACRIDRCGDAGYRVTLTDGRAVDATHVVVATGNGAPVVPDELRPYLPDGRVCRCPYPEAALLARLAPHSRVLVLGGRLSAVDAALVLCGEGHTATLCSPSGRLPAVRTCTPVTPRARLDIGALQKLDPHAATFRRSLLRLIARAAYSISSRLLSAQTSRAGDPIRRLREEIALAAEGRTDWQYGLAHILEAGNSALAKLKPEARGPVLQQVVSLCGRYLFAFPLQSARALAAYAEEDRFAIRADRLKHVAVDADRRVVTFASGAEETFDAIVCATGYEKQRVFADDESLHLVQSACGNAGPAVADPSLRLWLRHGAGPERVWLCGAAAHAAAPLENAVFQFVRQAHAIAAAIEADDAAASRSLRSTATEAVREGVAQ